MTTTGTSVAIGRRPSPVNLTDEAITKVAALLEQEGNDELALRVAVRPGGCSGYSYEMFFDSEIAGDDVVRTFGAVRVVVDPESAELIKGA
ncbi:MAG TPA: iron-sulfur cluster assembly accessory protein, partial [Acidimicrobiales bacterium]|nr:iron-sulfur cluster assembly accessory protein [Acidimicrobiales bacterium]